MKIKQFAFGAFVIATLSSFTLVNMGWFPLNLSSGEKMIDNFDKPGIWSWWGSSAIKVIQDEMNGTLKVNVTRAGDKKVDSGYSTFGRDHSMETLDFSETPVAKLRAKAEKDVTIRMNVKDIDDYVNNKDNVVLTLKGDGQWHDLYFDFSGKWKQNYPDDAIVDEEEIKEFIIFINPGGDPWSGTIEIDELSIVDQVPE